MKLPDHEIHRRIKIMQYEARLRIDAGIFVVMPVLRSNTAPSFCYTIGLSEIYNHPEIIISGLSINLCNHIFGALHQMLENNQPLQAGKGYGEFIIDSVTGKDATMKAELCNDLVKQTHTCQCTAILNTNDYQVIQLIYPDANNNYPDSSEYNHREFSQEILTFIATIQ